MFTQEIITRQRAFFLSGKTRPIRWRKQALLDLAACIRRYETRINAALQADMNKSATEVYMTETGIVLDEIRYHLSHLDRWARERWVRTPLAQFPSVSYVSPEPYGTVLIMSPWNYPVQLCLEPLVGALSAGCTAVLKPSAYAPATSQVLADMMEESFPPEYITVIQGGREENKALLEEPFDYIFFTGSPAVGHDVMRAAAEHLTPVTLELGGKSPVIVTESSNIPVAARRIAFGKVLNAGQTCVAPDYCFVHKAIKPAFIEAYREALAEFFPDGNMDDMNVIINEKHYARVKRLLASGEAVIGGGFDDGRRFIEPTLLDHVSTEAPVMQEEIFGPILPMLEYEDLEEPIRYIREHAKPLALYLFTTDRGVEKRIMDTCSFGGGCVNDTIIHLATPYMPFGGVGNSGMGSYHGKKSYDTFTHERSIVRKGNWLDLPVRYRPYTSLKNRMLRSLLK